MLDKFNIGDLLKGAKQIQNLMEKAKEDLEKIEGIGEAGAGAVQVSMSGKHYIKKITLDDEIIKEPKEILEELIKAAVNDAVQKIEKQTQSKMMDANKLFSTINEDSSTVEG